MKNFFYPVISLFILLTIFSCSAYKTADKEMAQGNYAKAFETSIKLFATSTNQKKKDKQLVILQNSYLKANEEEENALKELQIQASSHYKEIYYLYKSLYDRQNRIKPYLPLYNNGKELKFPVQDYSVELKVAKENYLNQYYTAALDLLATKNKSKARQAYEYLTEVKNVDSYYKEVSKKQLEAYNQGIDIVYVNAVNQTGVPFPTEFQNNFLYQFENSSNNFWTVFTTANSGPKDYKVDVIFRQAFVGNDIVTSNTYDYEKNIVDGWEYLKDRRGNIVRDSLGNTTKVDRYITVNARIVEFVRHKEAMLSADIQIFNLHTQGLNSYPVSSQFAFNASFATFSGDPRALNRKELDLVDTRPLPFPNSYEMINECGADLKNKIILTLNSYFKNQ